MMGKEDQVVLKSTSKNDEKSQIGTFKVLENSRLAVVKNDSQDVLVLEESLDKDLIQFFFCTKGSVDFVFHGGNYRMSLSQGKTYLLYNPQMNLPLELNLDPLSNLVSLFVSVEELHQLFVGQSDGLNFLEGERRNQKFYSQGEIGPMMMMSLDQILACNLSEGTMNIFMRGKALELLSYFFVKEEEKKANACPFLEDEKNVNRIREAKKILFDHMIDPPGLKELAKEVGLNEYRLKVGFKNIYGKSPYAYLSDYRMDQARKILLEGKVKVNEVAYQMGYTNPSHFITAFKKRFGITPKKFLTSLE